MFERFTDRARRVLVLAQEEARLLNNNFIGTEHVLFGLLGVKDGLAAQALASLGIRLPAARDKVEAIGPTGRGRTGSPPFTGGAKRVLEFSQREALELGHNYIGTEHLLLGIIRERDGMGAQVLTAFGTDLAEVRQRVITLMRPASHTQPGTSAAETPEGPRCPNCRSRLESYVSYRVLPVPPAGEEAASETIHVLFVYCRTCGAVIAHTNADRLADGA